MIYFLTTRRELPLVTAIEQVMKKRGTILTNIGFQKQLVRHCFNNGLKLKGESGKVRGKRKADSLCMNEAATVHGDSLCMNDAATVRGRFGCPLRSDAVVVKRGDTVLTRVGQIRQPSSQGSLPQMSLEQSRKQTIGLHRPSTTDSIRTEPETEMSVLNQMLTGFRINSNKRKIPGGCIEQSSGMSSESARIVKVDSENDMRGLSQLHHYMYTRPHSARVCRL